jgi:MarR family transcriptional regulator for hemolysin
MAKLISDFQLEQAIGLNVNRTAFLMTEEIAKRFAAQGYTISAQDFGILLRISKQGAMTQNKIAALLMRDKTTITRRIDGLVRKGLVERSPDEKDRRYFLVSLTQNGEKALAATIPLVQGFQEEVLSDISDENKAITIQTLKHIADKLVKKRSET